MKKKLIIFIAIIIVVIIGSLVINNKAGHQDESNINNADYVVTESDYVVADTLVEALPIQELTMAEQTGLIIMREEEKLARDVYLSLYDIWGINIFSNIAKSEQTHTEAVQYLIDRYDLVDPVKVDDIGVFTNDNFTELYNVLVEQGKQSLSEALIVGVTIEDLDIKDLQDYMAETDNEDILLVYDNLIRGSRNHLRAFSQQLSRQGGEYTAQYLTQAEIDEILSAQQERGGR